MTNHTHVIIYGKGNYFNALKFQEFQKSLKKSFDTWGQLTETSWLVTSEYDCNAIRDYLVHFMSNGDRLVVVETGSSAAWHNVMATNEFVKHNICNNE